MRDPAGISTSYGLNDISNDRYGSMLRDRRFAMTSELLIRPGMNDHDVIAELLAPASSPMLVPGDRRTAIDRLVADAHIARRRPQLAGAAAAARVPSIVDPCAPFL